MPAFNTMPGKRISKVLDEVEVNSKYKGEIE